MAGMIDYVFGEYILAKICCLPAFIGAIFSIQYGLKRRFVTRSWLFVLLYTINFVGWVLFANLVYQTLEPNRIETCIMLVIMFYFILIDKNRYTLIPIGILVGLFNFLLIVDSDVVHIKLLVLGTTVFMATCLMLIERRARIVDTFFEYELLVVLFAFVAWLDIASFRWYMPWSYGALLILKFTIIMNIVHFGNMYIRRVVRLFNRYQNEALVDSLTGMSNRRALDQVLEEVVPYFHTKRLPLTMVMFDIDSFKLINDTHGHAMGDYVLTRVAHIVNDTLIASNANGQVFRYGGEEFAIVFRNVKIEDILPKLETVMMAVRTSNFVFESQKANVTISMGVAELSKENDTAEAVMKKADDNLYDAKREGKNRIVLA